MGTTNPAGPGPTCLITGGRRGIGQAAAIAFAKAGYDVAVAARTAEQLAETRRRVEALGRRWAVLAADLSDPDAAARIVTEARQALGRIDVLMNNAGAAPLKPVEAFTLEEFDRTLAINVRTVFITCQAVWPIMKSQGGGTIINISSMAARDPFPGFAVYAATKAAVNLFSTGLAAEGRPHNIRVFALGPGAVETEMLRSTFPDFPAAQCLKPEEVAEFALLLADPRCRYASGEQIYIRKS